MEIEIEDGYLKIDTRKLLRYSSDIVLELHSNVLLRKQIQHLADKLELQNKTINKKNQEIKLLKQKLGGLP